MDIGKTDGASGKTSGAARFKSKSKEVNLVEPKVSQNVGITLAKIRLPAKDIMKAVLDLDDSILTLDKLTALRNIVPSSDDIVAVKEYKGDKKLLGKVESFFLETLTISNYASRLDALIYKQRFENEHNLLESSLELINVASNVVLQSKSLRRILEVVLAIGNYLNEGTPR